MLDEFGEILDSVKEMLDRTKFLYRGIWALENPNSYFVRERENKRIEDLEAALQGTIDVVGMKNIALKNPYFSHIL